MRKFFIEKTDEMEITELTEETDVTEETERAGLLDIEEGVDVAVGGVADLLGGHT